MANESTHFSIQFPQDLVPLTAGGWPTWSSRVKFAFMAAGLLDYITGDNAKPESEKKLAEWRHVNVRIIGVLGSIVEFSLQTQLHADMSAAEAWLFLKAETYPDGIAEKLASLRTVMKLRYSLSKSEAGVTNEINDCVALLYQGNVGLSPDEMTIIILLNALDNAEFAWLRRDIIGQLSRRGKMTVKDVTNQIKWAVFEWQRQNHNDEAHVSDAKKHAKPKSKRKCSNCNSPRHSYESCWAEGGGAVDEAPEWWKLKQRTGKP